MFLRNVLRPFLKSVNYPIVFSFSTTAKIMASKVNATVEEPVLRVTRGSKRKLTSPITKNEDALLNVSKQTGHRSLHSRIKAEKTGTQILLSLNF